MKKITLILLMITLVMITGCKDNKTKNIYLPEAKNDKIYTTVGGKNLLFMKHQEELRLEIIRES